MSVWTRSPSCERLIRVERPSHNLVILTIAREPNEMVDKQAQGPPHPLSPAPRSLNQIFYPSRSTNLFDFQIPQLDRDVQFSFSPQYTTMLAKFSEDGDAYLFLSEFEEVCSMMQYINVPQDIFRFRSFLLH